MEFTNQFVNKTYNWPLGCHSSGCLANYSDCYQRLIVKFKLTLEIIQLGLISLIKIFSPQVHTSIHTPEHISSLDMLMKIIHYAFYSDAS